MTLPTGTISMSEVNVEIGSSASAAVTLNNEIVRSTAAQISGTGVLSGTISMNNLRGAKGTQVINGCAGATINYPPLGGYPYSSFSVGFKTIAAGPPTAATYGTAPSTPLYLLGPGVSIVSYFYNNTYGNSGIRLYVSGTPNYTGGLVTFFSNSTSSWPTLGNGEYMYYGGTDSGYHYWTLAVSDNSYALGSMVGIRVQKA